MQRRDSAASRNFSVDINGFMRKAAFSTLFTLLLTLSATAQLQFTENRGQWPGQVLYRAQLNGGAFWAEKDRFTLELVHPDDWGRVFGHDHENHPHQSENEMRWRGHVYQMVFEGANLNCEIIKGKQYEEVKNYFIGSQENWASGAKSFHSMMYRDIYPGVILHLQEREGHIKYSFMLSEGADPSKIRIRYEFADRVGLQDDELYVSLSVNEVVETGLYAFQSDVTGVADVPVAINLDDNVVTFEFPEGYDHTLPLTIDPVLSFATYTGSQADNFGFTAAPDTAKNLVGGGIVFQQGYPLTTGSYDQTYNGGVDVGITKFTADGTNLIYSTYLGGAGDETPNSIIVNGKDELLIFGITGSADFPTVGNAFDQTFDGGPAATFLSNGTNFPSGTDMYVAKLSADGTGLLGSTFIGGTGNDGLNDNAALPYNYGDQFRGEVVVDGDDNVYIASCTQSADFPATAGVMQGTLSGGQDGCVLKLTPDLTSLTWATYLGGNQFDASYGLKVRQDGSVVVAGGTNSVDFPTTAGTVNPSALGGSADGYLAILNSSASALASGTFIGTNDYDQCYFVELDDQGGIYTYGQTAGAYLVTAGVYNNANSGQFVTKFNPGLSTVQFSTVFGKGDNDPEISPTAFLVDRCRNIYCSGWGGSTNALSPIPDTDVSGMPLTTDAFQSTTDGSDFYFIVLSSDAKNLLYATYFGGDASADHVDGGTSRFDADGIIYEAVCASCGLANNDFPTTPGAWSSTDQSSPANCNMAVLKFEFQLTQVFALAVASPATEGCAPYDIDFSNAGSAGDTYLWDFGDGNTSTEQDPSHTFTDPGTYQVQLIAFDTLVCNSSDTTEITITVCANATADFTWTPDPPIYPNDAINFTNNSAAASGYSWDFGDGNNATDENPIHSYVLPGTYTVCLTATNVCGCSDSICYEIIVSEIPVIDVPNAFSPNSDGQNDVFFARGSGVDQLDLRIYNRWGELMFESNNLSVGWDGTHKGVPQEMEVYVFILDAQLADGNRVFKKGNVTLVR